MYILQLFILSFKVRKWHKIGFFKHVQIKFANATNLDFKRPNVEII